MKSVFLVFLGGGLGSVVRYSLSRWVSAFSSQPLLSGTMISNVAACLILGFVVSLADQKGLISPSSRIFWTAGFCGGFSTFSTFSYETIQLIQQGLTSSVILYVACSLVLCTLAVLAGIYMGQQV